MKKFIPMLLAVAATPAFFAGAAPLSAAKAATCCCGENCKCEKCECTSSAEDGCQCQPNTCCEK